MNSTNTPAAKQSKTGARPILQTPETTDRLDIFIHTGEPPVEISFFVGNRNGRN